MSFKNFETTKSIFLKEIQSHLKELVHIPTGAKISQLSNNDTENCFCIGFQTLPKDSTGVAHILEHIVLCGSKKYPVKDPFFSMTRRSLNTFMNAFTGQDFTLYPASSENEKDFYNLLEVYLDAAFFPELKKISFNQEGHRLEIDKEGNLQFKGVVFNEMKGAMSSADQRLWVELFSRLMPDLPYSHNSGGDPLKIVDLSYENLKEFHKTHYHPSVSHFYFYGNLPLEKNLEHLEEKVLNHFTKQEPIAPLPLQKRFSSPKFSQSYFPGHGQKDGILAIGFLCCEVTDYEQILALSVLDSLLMDTDASILKKALLESKLCKEVNSGLDTEISEVPWLLIFKGVKEKNQKKLRDLVSQLLNDLAENPLPEEELLSSMHQLEFSRSEITGDRMPYGLELYMRAFISEPHGVEPEHNLTIHTPFKKLLEKIKDKNYLSSLIRKSFAKNTHRVDLFMLPDEALPQKEEEQEKKILEVLEKRLTKEDKEKIRLEAKELKKYQESIDLQNIDCLPTVNLEDIPIKTKDYPITIDKKNFYTTYFSNCHTNEILYLDLFFMLPDLSEDELFTLSLFTSFVTEVGTKKKTYDQNLREIQAYTGGFYASISLETTIDCPKEVSPSISLRTKGFYRNTEKLFSLLIDTALEADFRDQDRMKNLLLQLFTSLEHSLTEQSMRYAKYLSKASFSQAGTINEHLYGLTFYKNLKKLVSDLDKNLPSLIEKLEKLKALFAQKNFDLLVTCDKKHFEHLQKNNFFSIDALAQKEGKKWSNTLPLFSNESTLYTIASPVSFSSFALDSIGYTHKDSAALLVAAELLENLYLHEEIREKGGAYGSGASYHSYCSNFSFYGYRDPHISETLDHFKKSVKKLINSPFSAREVFEAKLGIFQSIDAPVAPKGRGRAAYHWIKTKKSIEKRQQYRDALFSVDKKQIQEALKKHVLPKVESGVFISFSGRKLIEKENKKLPKPLSVKDPAND